MNRWSRRGGLLLLALTLVGCRLPETHEHAAPEVSVPKSWAGDPDEVGTADLAPIGSPFWKRFDDPELDRLVRLALEDNRDLAAAWARLRAARAVVSVRGAAKDPSFDLSAEPSLRYEANRDFATGGFGPDSFMQRTAGWSLGANLRWATDLFGAIRSREAAAALSAAALRQRAEESALLLAGAVTEAWWDAREARALLEIVRTQEETSRELLELSELRFDSGLGSALDVLQQREQLVAATTDRPRFEAAFEVALQRLAILCGRPPAALAALEVPAGLPPLAADLDLGSPVDLLDRRPDLRAARLEVLAADREVAAAVADRLPTLDLLGSFSAAKTGGSGVFDRESAAISAAFLAPLLDGGRREAEVERREAELAERLETWAGLFLQALGEVEEARTREARQRALVANLERRLVLIGDTLDEARARYANGDGAYLNVLTAVQGQQNLNRLLLQERRVLRTLRVNLHLALGAAWTARLDAGLAPPEPTP